MPDLTGRWKSFVSAWCIKMGVTNMTPRIIYPLSLLQTFKCIVMKVVMEIEAFMSQIERRFGQRAATAFLLTMILGALCGALSLAGHFLVSVNGWLTSIGVEPTIWGKLFAIVEYGLGFALMIVVTSGLVSARALRRMERRASSTLFEAESHTNRANEYVIAAEKLNKNSAALIEQAQIKTAEILALQKDMLATMQEMKKRNE